MSSTFVFFFFSSRRRHTRFSRDWSSDVCSSDLGKWIDRIKRGRFDVAFNMCEGIDGVAEMEPPVISILELFGLAYTGGSSYTTALCLRKHVVNALLAQSGLPVPPWITLRRGSRIRSIGYPAIVKP